jgi:transposase InsO family protein
MTERGRFADEAEARRETFRWIAFYNNHRRRHRRARMLAPVEYERQRWDAQRSDGPATLISTAA